MARTYRPEIERALAYIAEHLEEPLPARTIARAARLSEFHLQRVFHAEVGESVGRFVTRRRLELAALRLAYEPDRSITEIALSSGYSSSSNFSKAFSAFFCVSPSQVREPTGTVPSSMSKLLSQYGKPFSAEALYTAAPGLDPEQRARNAERWQACVRYESVAEQCFASMASSGGYHYPLLEQTWRELISRAQQLGLVDGPVDAWGIAHDSPNITAPEQCRYHACVPCPASTPLAAPLFRARMPAGRYAVFHFQGPIAEVADAYRDIYACWFHHSSLAPADFTPFDHYITDFPKDGRTELELWFRVRPRRSR